MHLLKIKYNIINCIDTTQIPHNFISEYYNNLIQNINNVDEKETININFIIKTKLCYLKFIFDNFLNNSLQGIRSILNDLLKKYYYYK